MPVPRQPYTWLISPQQKTNLAPANQFDLHASDWCFHFHTIWIRLFKEITTLLPWLGVILLDYPTLNATFFVWWKRKKNPCACGSSSFRSDIKSMLKRLTSYRTHPCYSPGRLLSLTPGVFILRNIRAGQRHWLFASQDSGGCTKVHFL